MFRVAALSHFVVAVSSVVIARAAFLIRPRHRARRVAEPIANIAVGAVTAWYRPPAAAVLQGIIPARLKPRRHHPVPVALAVPLIEIVAVAARRRMAVTAVAGFPGPEGCFRSAGGQVFPIVARGLRRQCWQTSIGSSGEHGISLRPISAPEMATGIVRFHIDAVCALGKAGLRN